MLWVRLVLELGLNIRVLKVYICDTWSIRDTSWLVNAVAFGTDGDLLELHDVLSQSSRLVAKDVVDHA